MLQELENKLDILTEIYTPSGDIIVKTEIKLKKEISLNEIEKLVHIKNRLEADLDRDPSDAIAVAKLGEIKTLIKTASKYYELEV